MLPCGAPNALGQLTAYFVRRHPKGLTFPPLPVQSPPTSPVPVSYASEDVADVFGRV
jgi:hypothetical protein